MFTANDVRASGPFDAGTRVTIFGLADDMVDWVYSLVPGDHVPGLGEVDECDGPFFLFKEQGRVWICCDKTAGRVVFGETTFTERG